MGVFKGTDSRLIPTELSLRSTKPGQRIPTETRDVHVNYITGSDQLPWCLINNVENNLGITNVQYLNGNILKSVKQKLYMQFHNKFNF